MNSVRSCLHEKQTPFNRRETTREEDIQIQFTPMSLTLIYQLMLKIYLHTKMTFLGQSQAQGSQQRTFGRKYAHPKI